ncbi:MAG: hypothetical protein ABW133_17405 [Polyangiaceae bacterium]
MVRFLGSLGVIVVATALSSACSGPDDASVTKDGEDLVIAWDGAAARLCVTEPNAWCPQDKDDKVTGGKAFWVIDATCFNGGDGFPAPVHYRKVPDCAKDVTEAHGGPAGGAQLVRGETYRVMITGFGGDPAIQSFTW